MYETYLFLQFVPMLVLGILLAIPCHFVLKRKGYSGLLIVLCYIPVVGWFFAPIAIGLPDLVVREMIARLDKGHRTKKCPYCAEDIQEDAIVCRYCKKDL